MPNKQPTIKAIAKMERGACVLFFPEMLASYGCIVTWDGAHCEASLEYFHGLKPCHDLELIRTIVARYESGYCQPHQGGECLRLVKRDTESMRRARWTR